ncbi:MAG: M23 family metallopeptidase [Tannerella sp.]|jgi:murein DD-endopeptidase MepM/ murein hydrolase activator NlpD|nr:M23 family metallopeptidase [Tannerella sp.]
MGIFRLRKTYYLYNPKTLEYERIYPSAKDRFAVVLQNLSWGLLIGTGVFFAFMYLFDSPLEALLRKENRLLQIQYDILMKELDLANDVLEDLQQRDEHLYRAVFQADSIPMSIRKSGFGGSNRYEHLKGFPNSDLVEETTRKMDILKKQLYIQSNSLEELIALGKDMEDKIRCIPAIQPVSDKELKHMASGYGMRIDPFYLIPKFHAGMDFTANIGTEIYATGNGTVIHAAWKQGYGNCIIIDHGYDYKTLYGHIDKYKVKVGQKVSRGEFIATVGNTGKSKGPHLHYEVIYKGSHVNPKNYYFQDLSPEEYDRMLRMAENHGQVMD